jgi:bacitracin transport system permease protein
MKLKRNRFLPVCSAIALLWPILLMNAGSPETAIGYIFRLQFLCQLTVYPVLSGFIITFLIQREYADLTVINILTAPVSRIKFLLGKLIVWALWHIAITIGFLIISCAGVYFSYGDSALFENFPAILALVMKAGILFLGTLFPVAWVAVLQKKAFYPSLLLTLIMTALGVSGLLQPGLLGSLIPWAAVYLLVIPGAELVSGAAYASVIACTVVGFGLAVYSVKRQEL